MINKLIKKIGFICLGFASLSLAGCFHIPDEDRLPNRNKVNTGNIEKDYEVNNSINYLINGIDMISSERNELKHNENDSNNNEENNENDTKESERIDIETEYNHINNDNTTNNEEIYSDENKNQITENIIYEQQIQ